MLDLGTLGLKISVDSSELKQIPEEAKVAENGIKLEDMEVDESVISQEAHEKDSTQVEDINKNTISPVIDSGEINFGQPVQDKETKTTDDIEK